MGSKLVLCGTTQFEAMLRQDGFTKKPRKKKGSHVCWIKRGQAIGGHFVVTVQLDQNEYGTELLRRMINQAGWSLERYSELLASI